MRYTEQLLELLEANKGSYLSGEAIAKQLFITRNTVWKTIRFLQEEGYPIKAVTNRGYLLAESADILSVSAIRASLTEPDWFHITYLPEVTSTNTLLKEQAINNAPEGTLLVATAQTAGRGRMGRQFLSPEQSGIYFSLLVRPSLPSKDALMLTTSVAVAVKEAIDALTGLTAQIKWVNDIYVEGRKVCGILSEASIDFETLGLEYAIIGIGINLEPPTGGFPDAISGIAGALFPSGQTPSGFRAKLVAEIMNRFLPFYRHLADKAFLPAYREASCIIGKEVSIIDDITHPEITRAATCLAIDDDCRLQIQLADGSTEWLNSGDVSLRLHK